MTNWPDVGRVEHFVAVKATDGTTTPTRLSAYYQDDVTGAVAAALRNALRVRQPYGSSAPAQRGSREAAVQADFGWKTIGAATPAYKTSDQYLPVVVDMESDPYVNGDDSNACYGLSQTTMVNWITAFITETTKDSGMTPSSTPPLTGGTCTGNTTAFSGDPLWIAAYGVSVPSIPPGWSTYTFWQYSESGTIGGIGGAADLDSLGPHPDRPGQHDTGSDQIQTLSSLAAQTIPSGRHRDRPAARGLDQRFRADTGRRPPSAATRDGHPAGRAAPASCRSPG